MLFLFIGLAALWIAAVIIGILVKAAAWLAIAGVICLVGTVLVFAVFAARKA